MLSEKRAIWYLNIIIPIFIAVVSIFILANKVPESEFLNKSVERLEENKGQVLELTGATVAASLAISALPDDFASPMANTLSDLNKYFVILLAIIFLEKWIVVYGIKGIFLYLIPLACGLYVVSVLLKKDWWAKEAYKVSLFAIAVILIVPCSVRMVDVLGKDSLAYVDETINEANMGAKKITDVSDDGNHEDTIFEKLSDAFTTATKGVDDLMKYFNNVMKKSINSIAILFVTTFVVPMMVLAFFKWLIKELFGIKNGFPEVGNFVDGFRKRKKSVK